MSSNTSEKMDEICWKDYYRAQWKKATILSVISWWSDATRRSYRLKNLTIAVIFKTMANTKRTVAVIAILFLSDSFNFGKNSSLIRINVRLVNWNRKSNYFSIFKQIISTLNFVKPFVQGLNLSEKGYPTFETFYCGLLDRYDSVKVRKLVSYTRFTSLKYTNISKFIGYEIMNPWVGRWSK